MSTINPHLAANATGLVNPIDFTTPATDPLKVQALIDVISREETPADYHRLFLDQMSPPCRDSLYKILTDLKAAVT